MYNSRLQPLKIGDIHNVAKYTVQSTDVLADMRVNVSEEGSEKVIWYKERFLSDDEIIENLVESVSSTVLWTIHRPKRGWYIRLRSPSFPPGMFIPLTPLPQSSPYYTDAALTFSCRTNPPSYSLSTSPPQSSAGDDDSFGQEITIPVDSPIHSYPPTPQTPTIVLSPPSPKSVKSKLPDVRSDPSGSVSPTLPNVRPPRSPLAPITHFLLTPHSTPHVPHPTEKVSFFSRMVAMLKNNAPSHLYSFTLSPIPLPAVVPPSVDGSATNPPTPVPLLTFHDRTPMLTVRQNSGFIEVDTKQVRTLGVQTSFYIAVALTYFEFQAERESYLAALSD